MDHPQADEVDTIWLNARLATLAPDRPGLGIVEKGAVAARGGRIAFAGLAGRAAPKPGAGARKTSSTARGAGSRRA